MGTTVTRIIGIDPGLRRTGWGVVDSDGVRLSYVASGLITSPADADARLPTARAVRRHRQRHRQLQAARSGGRGDVRQRQRALHVEAGAGARHGAAGARDGRPAGRRISAQPHQEIGDRRRACREAADRGDDRLPAAEGARAKRRRGGRACHRHLPCQSSPGRVRLAVAGSRQPASCTPLPAAWGNNDRQAQRQGRHDRRELLHRRRRRRRLRGAGLGAHAAQHEDRRRRRAHHRHARARGRHPPVRLRQRGRALVVPHAAERAGRRLQGGARRCSARSARRISPTPSRSPIGPASSRHPASARSWRSASSPS